MQSIDTNKINLDTAYKFSVGDDWRIQGSQTDVFEWYRVVYPDWYMVYPGYQAWTQVKYIDSTQKAMDIVQELREKKLLRVKTVKEFIDIVDIVRKRL